MSDGQRLAGKVAIITGAASGIGRATAILFLQQGAKVFVVDLPEQSLRDQFNDYEHARGLEIDVTDADAPQRIVDGTVEVFGGIDILMNNAGIATAAEFESTTDETWDRVVDVNVTSMFRISRQGCRQCVSAAAGGSLTSARSCPTWADRACAPTAPRRTRSRG